MEDGCQLDLTFAAGTAGRTQLIRRHIAYPYHAAAPVPDETGVARLVLQSVSGGLYGGERLGQRMCVETGARAALVQPAASVVRRMSEGASARQAIRLEVAPGAWLAYLARPLIFMPGGALEQRIEIVLAPGGRLLLRDGFLDHQPGDPGREWRFRSHVAVRAPEGRLLAAERLTLGRDILDAARPGLTGSCRAFGKLWLLGAAPSLVASLSPQIEVERGEVYAAASALPGACGIALAIAAPDGGALDAAMERLTRLLLQNMEA